MRTTNDWTVGSAWSGKRRRFENSREGRCELYEHLGLLSDRHGGATVMAGYEASALGFGLYDDCRDNGVECVILAPTKIPRSVEDRKRKTDDGTRRGSSRLCGLTCWRATSFRRSGYRTSRRETIGRRCGGRLDLTEKLTAVKAQVRMLLKRNRVEKPEEVGASWAVAFRGWLAGLKLKAGAQSCLSSLLRQPRGSYGVNI